MGIVRFALKFRVLTAVSRSSRSSIRKKGSPRASPESNGRWPVASPARPRSRTHRTLQVGFAWPAPSHGCAANETSDLASSR
jgi:hypothetical protein